MSGFSSADAAVHRPPCTPDDCNAPVPEEGETGRERNGPLPSTPAEEAVAAIWREVLGLGSVGRLRAPRAVAQGHGSSNPRARHSSHGRAGDGALTSGGVEAVGGGLRTGSQTT